ncbi:MAG: arginine--tRNA ligase [Candidatus Neomarinimicrobiota bacterium]|tara:strand:- start:321 stop:1940 length:1620 start_codon:yes stop_codon:yes gene_type:complete
MIQKKLESFINGYLKANDLEIQNWHISSNKKQGFGDYSSNIALALSKQIGQNPMEIAEKIIASHDKDELLFSVSVTKPGFINFHISDDYYLNILKNILDERTEFGKPAKHTKTANVEFVSSNPTGPLTAGHGRNTILGDMVSSILTWHGYSVTREYYYNNAGKQMRMLAESAYAKYATKIGRDVTAPENGYIGQYLDDIVNQIIERFGENLDPDSIEFRQFTEKKIFDSIKRTLKNLGIEFDLFSEEQRLYENGAIDNVLKKLEELSLSYKKDGATWFKTTSLGKKEDKVLVKSTGEPTYRLPDIAYHIDKVDRGFDLIVDIFGADHIDTYPDVLLGLEALGKKTDHIKVIIHQFVTLKKGNEVVKMSTRKANFITLDDLVEQLGVDVVRYFFIMRGANSHLDFDFDLAKDESEKNPVYYLQYAHARISNLIVRYDKEIKEKVSLDLSLLKEKDELSLIKKLSAFPTKMNELHQSLEPRKLATYLEEVAAAYHKFYGNHKVINLDNIPLSYARKNLCNATQIILKTGLSILGITAPEKM